MYAQERSPREHSPGSLSVFRNSSTTLKTETGNKLNFSNGKESAPAVKLFHPWLEENRRWKKTNGKWQPIWSTQNLTPFSEVLEFRLWTNGFDKHPIFQKACRHDRYLYKRSKGVSLCSRYEHVILTRENYMASFAVTSVEYKHCTTYRCHSNC